jgi:hypothetical protein
VFGRDSAWRKYCHFHSGRSADHLGSGFGLVGSYRPRSGLVGPGCLSPGLLLLGRLKPMKYRSKSSSCSIVGTPQNRSRPVRWYHLGRAQVCSKRWYQSLRHFRFHHILQCRICCTPRVRPSLPLKIRFSSYLLFRLFLCETLSWRSSPKLRCTAG